MEIQQPSSVSSGVSMAIVHEWLSARAGSEILFEQLASVFPSAELFALTRNPDIDFEFDGRSVHLSPMQKLGPLRERRGVFLPLMPLAWKMIKKADYDVVVSSSHAFAREFSGRNVPIHCSYVHSPMRYAWTPELDRRGNLGGIVSSPARTVLRALDRRTVPRTSSFAANSAAVRSRIREFYDRDARVIHPPVDVEFYMQTMVKKQNYVLAASRWIPYKRLDLAIEAAALVGVRIKIAGSGPSEKYLRSVADELHPGGVDFLQQPDRGELRDLMGGARAFIFPAHEDFGIISVEAQAAGTPVVGLAAGGTLDTVRDGVTGILATKQTPAALAEALRECLDQNLEARKCREHALSFGPDRFDDQIRSWVREAVSEK